MKAEPICTVGAQPDASFLTCGAIPAPESSAAREPLSAPARSIRQLAGDRLRSSPYPAIRSVACECHDGVLVLRGHLPSYYYKQLAQEAVAEIECVRQVINETEVMQ